MSPFHAAHGRSGEAGGWAPGEPGVLPSGRAEAARARLDRRAEATTAAGAATQPVPARGTGTALGDHEARRPDAGGEAGGVAAVNGSPPVAEPPADAPAAGPRTPSVETTVVRAGLPGPDQGEPFLPGPVLAAPFHVEGDPEGVQFSYGRMNNPTWARYEAALGGLEGGESVVFASGVGAISAVLLTQLGPGDLLVAPNDGYPAVPKLAREHLGLRGVGVRLVPTDDDRVRRAVGGASLVWLESPSNPGLHVLDLEATIAVAKRAGALVVVDNTLATPLRQRPLDLGADIVVASASKHITGHADVVLGHAATRDPALAEQLRTWRIGAGAVPGPFETWLAHRSLPTLALRLARQETGARALHEALGARHDVRDLRYPGFGTVLGFDLSSPRRAQAFIQRAELVDEATSFGGVHTTAERRERWNDGTMSPGYVRFSVGIEDPDDLVASVLVALDAVD